jgi:hypothetical protein
MEKIIKKWTAAWAAIAFTWMAMGIISPGQLKARTAKAENAVSTVEAVKSENIENNSFEKEGTIPEIAKKKKFPWLWVAAGVVAAGVIVYFTLIKKPKYDLLVETGTGVTGTPAAGKYTYKKGQKIAYSFAYPDGYKNLTVLLDGNPVAISGTIVMDRIHTLKAAATQLSEYTLTVNIENGVNGTPVTGTYRYREGTVVTYQYSIASKSLAVTLDDVSLPRSGSLVIDRDHVLKVEIAFTLTVNVESGIYGGPSAGTYRYREVTKVPYQYFAEGLVVDVKLDDRLIHASGFFMMDKDHVLQVAKLHPVPPSDIRGEWLFSFENSSQPWKTKADISFSGTQASGVTLLLNDWEGYKGMTGTYSVISGLVKIYMESEDYPRSEYSFNGGYFTSSNSMAGFFDFYYFSDPFSDRIKGTWTATRIK